MTQNSNGPEMVESSRVRESNAVVAAASMPQGSDTAHQRDALFPSDPALPIARPVPVQTSGRLEFAARCPECRDWHRHIGLGEKDAPCGARYLLQFKTKLKGAA